MATHWSQPEWLRNARKLMGMTQQQLAYEIGMNRVTIGRMERGQEPIEKRTALAVAYIYHTGERRGMQDHKSNEAQGDASST